MVRNSLLPATIFNKLFTKVEVNIHHIHQHWGEWSFQYTPHRYQKVIWFSQYTEKWSDLTLDAWFCSEENWTLLFISKLADQRTWKALFTCVVNTNTSCIIFSQIFEGQDMIINICILIEKRKWWTMAKSLTMKTDHVSADFLGI